MPGWLMEAGAYAMLINATSTPYLPLAGFLCSDLLEAAKKTRIRDSYTWARLYVRVTLNTRTADCPVISRINGINGNQTITIPALTTGVFEDNVNSDNIVNDDLVNWRLSVPSGGSNLYISVVSSFLTSVSNVTISQANSPNELQVFGITRYYTVLGVVQQVAAEVDTQQLLRQASTLSNLRAYIKTNNLDGASTLRLRVNGADVNQVLDIGAATTGEFEDAVNTDDVVSGNRINYAVVTGGTAGVLGTTIIHIKSAAPNRWLGCAKSLGRSFDRITTYYTVGESSLDSNNVEANVQTKVRGAINLKNLLVKVLTNNLNSASTFRTRKNAGNGNLNVSIGAAATGEFEDTGNSDSYAAADLFNFQLVAGGTDTETILLSIAVVEQYQTAAPTGIEDKSANMGNKMVGVGLI